VKLSSANRFCGSWYARLVERGILGLALSVEQAACRAPVLRRCEIVTFCRYIPRLFVGCIRQPPGMSHNWKELLTVKTSTYDSWVGARNAANDFAGVGGRVIGADKGFVAIRSGFIAAFVVQEAASTTAAIQHGHEKASETTSEVVAKTVRAARGR